MSMGDVRMQTGIIGVFRGEKKETQKRDRKHFPGLRKPWQNSGQEKLINLRFKEVTISERWRRNNI